MKKKIRKMELRKARSCQTRERAKAEAILHSVMSFFSELHSLRIALESQGKSSENSLYQQKTLFMGRIPNGEISAHRYRRAVQFSSAVEKLWNQKAFCALACEFFTSC